MEDELELCHDRRYLVSQPELDQTINEFKEEFGEKPSEGRPSRSDLDIRVSSVDNPADQMFVFFPNEPKAGIKAVKGCLQRMEAEGVSRGIVILQTGITPSAKQALTALAPHYILEMFLDAEILVNITEHKLVPKHILLTQDEKRDLLTKYKVTDRQLPRIKHSDPVAKYYGLRRGELQSFNRHRL